MRVKFEVEITEYEGMGAIDKHMAITEVIEQINAVAEAVDFEEVSE